VSQTVSCNTHGARHAAFACRHVFATLEDNKLRGLFLGRDENGCFNGWCADCEEMAASSNYDWTPEMMAVADVRLLYEECFRAAMKINNVSEGH
jgi:hypothetical protein